MDIVYWFLMCLLFFSSVNRLISRVALRVFILGMFFIMAMNTYNSDYIAYQYIYNQIVAGENIFGHRVEIGFTFLFKILSLFSNQYSSALIIITFIVISIFYWFINKYSRNPNIVFFLYCLYPFFYDISQIRNVLAFSLILVSMNFFLEGKNKISAFFFVLACTIHISMFLYVSMYLARFKFTYKNLVYIFIGNAILLVSIFLNAEYFLQRFDSYFDITINHGWMVIWFIYFSMMTVFFLLKDTDSLNIKKNLLYKIGYIYMVSFGILLPISFYSLAGDRIIRNVLLLMFLCISNCFTKMSNSTRFFIMLLTFGVIIVSIYAGNYIQEANLILNHNTLFE